MTFLVSLTVAIIFGAGSYLILQRNLIRVAVGILLISNAANLFIVAAARTQGPPPIHPLGAAVSDPLVQAMALTAIVIGSSIAALLLAIGYRLYTTHRTIDVREISRMEVRASEAIDRGEEQAEADRQREGPRRDPRGGPR
jgi:multicomponent Na+:H+ antiporter subunit C